MNRTYVAIDLKSYYASVECAARSLDPLTTHLVVADKSRTEKTICLAVSPSLKAHGISGRARLFEVVERVRAVNAERLRKAKALGLLSRGEDGAPHFSGASSDAKALAADPSLELSYITAPPRMKLYEEISARIFGIYRKYVSEEDIHVYSIDECFIDVTGYLKTCGMTARELTMTMIRDVLATTGITAAAGIGTNLYLAKVAMDIVAKHVPADRDGVRIAELNETSYRDLLWCHEPITDFWRVGRGLARRLEKLGCRTMGEVARLSLTREDRLYDAMGINAELLIDHAWGWEPTDIAAIRAYRPETASLSAGQVLSEPCDADRAKLIVREMTELLVLDLVRKHVVTRQITLTVNYDRESLLPLSPGRKGQGIVYVVARTGKPYRGTVAEDYYGRPCPRHAHGTGNPDRWTSSTRRIMDCMMALYDRIVDPDLLVRRITIAAVNLIGENEIPAEGPTQLDFFTDYTSLEKQREQEKLAEAKEKRLQRASLLLQSKFGKNAVLKGMNLLEGATTIQRNQMIGGHRAGETDSVRERSGEAVPESSSGQHGRSEVTFKEKETDFAPDHPVRGARAIPDSDAFRNAAPRAAASGSPDPRVVFADIIELPRHRSKKHPPMSLHDRAAQFAAYRALSGYEDLVAEEARQVEERIELSGEEKEALNRKLNRIGRLLENGEKPAVTLTRFVPDPFKEGGRYETVTEQVRRLDAARGKLVLSKTRGYGNSPVEIDFNDILDLSL